MSPSNIAELKYIIAKKCSKVKYKYLKISV